jgi:hypothetical protein
MKAMAKNAALLALALTLASALVTCNQVILTAPAGSTISVFANPEFIPVTAFIGGAGAPAPAPSASPSPGTGGGSSGGSTSATVEITIGSALPDHVLVTANPIRIRQDDPRQSRIVANVFDANGNAVQNVPVIFTVDQVDTTANPTELMASGGAPVFTDSNGQAIDFLQTRYPRDATPKTVKVTATTANGKTADVVVQIN